MSDREHRRPSLLSSALLCAVAVAVLSLLVVELYDLDLWWHLAIGRSILEHGAVPTRDAWTVLGFGREYHDSHWLFQVLIAAADRAAGSIGVQSVMVSLWLLALAAVWRTVRRHVEPEVAAALVLLVALTSSERFLPRPELATVAALAWFVAELAQDRAWSAWRVARLALLQLLWTNSHGLFVLGPAVVGCHAVSAVLRSRPRGELVGLWSTVAATAVASLVNPWGLGAWSYALLLMTEASGGNGGLVSTLGEMTSPFAAAARTSPAMWCYYVLVMAFVAALVVLRGRRWLRGDVLVALITLALSVSGRRNVVLFAVASMPTLAEAIAAVRWPSALRGSVARLSVLTCATGIAAAVLSGAYFLRLELPARTGFGATPSFFPASLGAFIRRSGFSGRILNSNTLGGFVSYQLAPKSLPLTDGRWELQDQAQLERALAASRTRGGWRSLLALYRLDGILLAHTSPEAAAMLPDLAQAADWKLVYLDNAASFWLPTTQPNSTPALDLSDARSMPALARSEDALFVATFASAVGANRLTLAACQRGLTLGWRTEWFLEQLGEAQVKLELWSDAERTFRQLLARDGEHPVALNELAFLAFQRGEPAAALTLLDRLIAHDPANRAAIENRERVARAMQGAQR